MKIYARLALMIVAGILLFNLVPASAQSDNTLPPLFVAALGERKDTWSIVMLDPQADGPEYLTDDEFDEIAPLVSADGRYVVFLRGDFSTDAPLEYYVLDRECLPDCEPRPLPDEVNQMADLRWSPVGPQLVAWGKDNAVWWIDVKKNSVKQIIGGKWNANPSWSPDGSMIVVSSDVVPPDALLSDDIQIIPANPGASENDRINLTYSGLFTEEVRPQFAPDGEHIAYLTRNLMGDTADPLTSAPVALLTLETSCIEKPETCLDTRQLLSDADHAPADFAWSPDSQYIAYRTSANPFGGNDPGHLWLVEIGTGEITQLTEGNTAGSYSWSPDSRAVVYEHSTENTLDVYIVFIDGRREPGPVLEGFRASATPYWGRS